MDELVTDMHAHGPGDFFEMFAAPLPIGVFAELLGLSGDLHRFKQLSDALMAEGMNNSDATELLRIVDELNEY
ncbi:MAG: hypothetical protein DIU75_006935 [Mycolicibacterium hassiacum]